MFEGCKRGPKGGTFVFTQPQLSRQHIPRHALGPPAELPQDPALQIPIAVRLPFAHRRLIGFRFCHIMHHS